MDDVTPDLVVEDGRVKVYDDETRKLIGDFSNRPAAEQYATNICEGMG